MPILTNDGKRVEKRYTADGKNVRTVYNADGDVVFEEIDTAEGTLPQTFKSRGKPLVNYKIYGNTVQNGTPTPSDPIEVQGCGVRTENIFSSSFEQGSMNTDGTDASSNNYYRIRLRTPMNNKLAFSTNTITIESVTNNNVRVALYKFESSDASSGTQVTSTWNNLPYTVEVDTSKYYRILLRYADNSQISPSDILNFMIVEGSTAPTSYIPYGYKLDITSTNALENTSVTTPVYIGQSPIYKIGDYADYIDYKKGGVVRRIKELVLTGAEEWIRSQNNDFYIKDIPSFDFRFTTNGLICSHYPTGLRDNMRNNSIAWGNNYVGRIVCRTSIAELTDFKAYLAAQYAAGTPVKVYYVLATPEFEPIADLPKIPTYAPQTVLDADMTIKPNKIWYKYKPQSYLEYFKSLRTGAKYQVKIPKFAYDTTTDCIKQ